MCPKEEANLVLDEEQYETFKTNLEDKDVS